MLRIFVFSASVLLVACTSIPKEAPVLSAELGKRIAALESAHISMLRSWMDEKRDRVDEFLMREWVPEFARNSMEDPLIKSTWDQVCQSGDANDRLQFLVRLGPRIQARINDKRIELMKPLDDLEITIERRLRDDYLLTRSINNSITSFLASASEVAENRDRFLNMLGVQDDITEILDAADSAVSELVTVRDEASDKVTKFKDFREKIEDSVKKLKNSK